MPLFEYVCGECGQGFEKLVRFAEAEVRCPYCDSQAVQRQLSLFAVTGGADPSGCSPSFG